MFESLIRQALGRRYSRLSDDYITWLSFANAGMTHPGNVWCMDYAMANLPGESPIVEIGAFCGLSINIMSYLKLRHGRKNKLFTCDAWRFEGARPGAGLGEHPHISHDDYRQFVKDTFIRNVKFFSQSDLPYALEMTSDQFFEAWNAGAEVEDVFGREVQLGGPISFAFIDGNHSYEFANRDFINTDKSLAPGGFVFFDDSGEHSDGEVCKVVAEVGKLERYRLIKRNPFHLFKKVQ